MEVYKFNNTIFIKPRTMLFNAVGMDELIDLATLDDIGRLQKVKEIFNSLECIWIDTLFWVFDDEEKKIMLKGTMTAIQEKEFAIDNLTYLKELANCIGYKMSKSLIVQGKEDK